MAIQQVSRITVRKGLAEELPQPLAGAELGWALDQRKLYIGNGTLADGAPIVGNTEILTEFSDLFEYSAAYTYLGEAGGYTVQTGATSGSPISQSLQSRLDSYAVVTDFGVVGDGVTDNTAAINRAMFELYCKQDNVSVRRALFFPAGTYKVSDTILIPPYARLYGDGAKSSIIRFEVLPWTPNTPFDSGVLVSYLGAYYRSKKPVGANGIDITNTEFWQDGVTLPPYVARTSDNRQQIGINIGNSATAPTMVSISNMGFATSVNVSGGHDVFLAEQINSLVCREVAYLGPLTQATLTVTTNELAGLRLDGTSGRPCRDLVFDSCEFSGLTYGIKTPNITRGVNIKSSSFVNLHQGVVLGGSPSLLGGPSGFRLMGNTFDNIYHEGLIIQDCSLNGSSFNTFIDVANRFGSVILATPVIRIAADNNISVGDMFSQTDDEAAVGNPRIELYDSAGSPPYVPSSIAITNSRTLQLGAYTRFSGIQTEIEDGTTIELVGPTVNSVIQITTGDPLQDGNPRSFVIDYTMIRLTSTGRAIRTGKLLVISAQDGDSAGEEELVWTDDFTENISTDLQFVVSGVIDGATTVQLLAEPTGFDGTIYFSLNYLA